MSETNYNFSILNDFPNAKVNTDTLSYEIRSSLITKALDFVSTNGDICEIWFKEELSINDATAILSVIIANHQGNVILTTPAPTTPDGVPIVRADSRPLNTETYFTCCGDSTAIGDGKILSWDFSNDDDLFTNPEWMGTYVIPIGFKAKKIKIKFTCPVHLKDGTLYFYDAPWGCNISMYVSVPAGSYYPNPAGSIPASALGLTTGGMYSYAEEDVPYSSYLMRHMMFGSCPMGDELNAECASLNPIPVGWQVCGLIVTPESDNISRGFGSLEMYRCHSWLLPGQTIASVHA